MDTPKEWLEKYETVKHLLVAPVNYAEVFEKNEIHEKYNKADYEKVAEHIYKTYDD